MNVKHLMATLIIFLGIATIPVASAIQSNWYVGAGTGSSDIDRTDLDDDSGTKFYAGYHFTDRYALEGGYTDLGTFDINGTSGTVDVDGYQVAGIARFPLRDRFSIFGKAGVYMWDSDVSITGGTPSDDGTDITYGFGFQFSAGNWGVRGEWERFDESSSSDDDIELISVGVIYRR